MINRVLIRLKVVQTLYSYMLSRSEFKIETPVETSSADRRYSFQAYAELLLLMLELCGQKVVRDRAVPAQVAGAIAGAKFEGGQVAKFLMANDQVRSLMQANAERMPQFDSAVEEAVQRLKASSAYRTLLKARTPEIADEIAFWTAAMRTTLPKVPAVVEALRTNPDFTIRGMEMGARMLAETLANYSDTRNVLISCRNDLTRSLDQAYELYHALLRLPVELTRAQAERLEANAAKYLPTAEDLNPDRRFVDSPLIEAMTQSEELSEYFEAHPMDYITDPLLIQSLLDRVVGSEPYREFMAAEGPKTAADHDELWRKLFRTVLLPSDDLADALETRSIFWNDDLEVISSFALKTIKMFAREGSAARLQPEFKDEEDEQFGPQLFRLVVDRREEYRELIDEFINAKKWDSDRLALMDIVILMTALAEVEGFPNIPLTVTANEYVEIANWYSNPRSGSFINGMLAAITDKLRRQGKIMKTFNQ